MGDKGDTMDFTGGSKFGVLTFPLAAASCTVIILGITVWWWLTRQDIEPFLNKERRKITLIDRSDVSHDTLRLVFALDRRDQPLGLPVGQHIVVYGPNRRGRERGKWNGKEDTEFDCSEVSRKYTPVSSVDTKGTIELIVKVYKEGGQPAFPDGGKISQHLEGLEIGDQVEVSGPFGRIKYNGWGSFEVGPRKVTKKRIGLLAGGTGITPVFQVIRRVLENSSDRTTLYLIYANKTEDDILLRDELEEFYNEYPDRFRLWYTVDSPPPRWKYSTGYITAEMIKDHLPPPADDVMVFCCGPKPMVKHACMENLDKLGYKDTDVATF